MRRSLWYNGFRLLLLAGIFWLPADGLAREVRSLDAGWRFFPGDAAGAEQGGFADASWRPVDLPHDWSIAGPFSEANPTGGAGAFLPGGVVWYRREIVAPPAWSGLRVWVEFDGVMQNSDVWINGFHLGHRPNGYVGFRYELTGHLRLGGTNVLAVRADTRAQPASRWYSGGGIYRHVRLVAADAVHVDWDGVFVSTPQVSAESATVRVETAVTNESPQTCAVTVRTELLSPSGQPVGTIESGLLVAGGTSGVARQQVVFSQPQRWSPDAPVRYRAVTQVRSGDTVLDEQTTAFGIREATFSPETGFQLNGAKVMLKGVCLHQDGGTFGVAVPLSVWADRLQTLRSLGVNAIRTAHNPPAPEFLELCDRMGFFVMDEFFDCWTVAKNPYDYHLYFQEWSARDAADMVRRDRNHPSVILYSIGNEIHDTPKPAIAIPIARRLTAICHTNDPTRPVTQALFRPNKSGDYTNGLADTLDVIGTNYRDRELLAAQQAQPGRKIIDTEQIHDRQAWLGLRDHPSLAGQFLWTGVDYLGESRRWPRVGHAAGLLDRTGAVKPMAFERQSWWSATPMVRMVRRLAADDRMPNDPGYGGAELHTQVQFADWTPANLAPHPESVEAYSNCEEVELFLNGKSLGAQPLHADASPRVWKVGFTPGSLRAVARNGGRVVASDELRTAGPPARIELVASATRLVPNWDSVAEVRATVVDAAGIPVPRADHRIVFSLAGPAAVVAVDNGDNDSPEPFQASERHAYHGTCAAFVRAVSGAPGPVTVTAASEGLTAGALKFVTTD